MYLCKIRRQNNMKMKNLFISAVITVMTAAPAFSQHNDIEPADPKPAPEEVWQGVDEMYFGWGSIDVRYRRNAVPELAKSVSLYAWKGERVNAQAVLVTPEEVESMSIRVSDLKKGKHVIPAEDIDTYFVRYVMSDYYESREDSCLVADRLEPSARPMSLKAKTVRPVWMNIHVPQAAEPGRYKGTLTAVCDGRELNIPFSLEVGGRTLPEPSEWSFHLDLWQNPYSVARHYNVPLWSREHFDLMRPLMTKLAGAGQKVITTSIIKHPWNGQTEHPFESMIGKKKCMDGTWEYDYKVFDMWVEFMMSCGIDRQIDCYTIVPWHLKFEYYNEAENCTNQIYLEPGTKGYEEYLVPFLTDFAAHLKQKGWFGRTCIAMDERPKELLEPAYEVLYKSDKEWKVKGAINFFGPETAERMHDISFIYNEPLLTPEQLDAHHGKGNLVTYYTCCYPERPNTFTFSNPAESVFLGWHTAAANYDGYLRWAYNSWTDKVLTDTRFGVHWAAGDCFLVYPGGSSIRMERLIEGIQDFEKIRILREEVTGPKLDALNNEIKKFEMVEVGHDVDVEAMIKAAKAALRKAE